MSKLTNKTNKPKAKKAVKAKVAPKAKAKAKAVSTKTPPRAKSGTYKAKDMPKVVPKDKKITKELKDSEMFIPLKMHSDNNNNHYHAILGNIDDKHVSVGFTTKKKKGQNKNSGNNYTLKRGLFDDDNKSFARRQGVVDYKDRYFNPCTGKIDKTDFVVVKSYGNKAKEKYLKNKKKK